MHTLILIKHSQPHIDPAVPACEWSLSLEGRRRCGPLAEALREYRPSTLLTSTEPKARQTAELVAAQLGIACEPVENLHEHERRTVGLLTATEFEESVRRLFAQPQERIFGEETAREALERFAAALEPAVAARPADCLAVVTHGTVISLYTASRCGMDGFDLWRQLGLPSFVVLAPPDARLLRVVPQVTDHP